MKRTIISLLLCTLASASMAQVSSQNYIRSRRMLSATDSSYVDNITYYDGQGRAFQTVSKSVQSGTVKERMATLQEYDGKGRATVSWLPTPITEDYIHPYDLRSTAKGTTGYNDTYPCETTVYENSPLDRVWLQYGAGVAWNSSHPVTTHYLTNSASGDLSCKLYTTDGTTLGSTATHAAGTLYVTKTTDEDGNVSYTFVDGEERTLLERRMNGTEQLDTYYVYDDYGRLCFVLQPMYQTTANVSLYAFQYRYNNRGLCIWKKLPGAEHILYEYDEADRMAFSQDGNQRTTGKWTFYVYDNLNRLVQQGESSGKNTSGTVMIRNYYDDYSFVGTGLFTNQEFVAGSASAKGKLTGCQAYPINVASPARTVYHYDSKGRMIKETASNALGGFDIRTITYTFTDQPATVTHTHTANGKPSLTEVYTYTYDHSDRISSVTHKLNNGNTVTLANCTYDNKGRMATKKLHGSSSNQLTYAYNIRSWLTGISSNKFTQNLTYNNGSTGFNGNITAMNWTANGSSHSYAFTYDGVNRMLNATHGTGAYTEKVTEYDKNGNIKYLHRYNNGSLVDNLTYIYNGNRLTKVEDATGNTAGFKNGASQENEYTYDANGNLTKDSNKGIASITYNSLNLPQQIQYTNGFVVNYGYSADGVKQRVQHPNSGLPDVVYCGNVIYEGGAQKFLLTEEGYVDLSTSTPVYYYYLKDHQGNNRVVVNSSGTVQEVNHYYPFGSTFATSNVQPYKYNGKELDTKNGLNWYDYGARHYDAALGRWHVMDPLAEKYYSSSPFVYCNNNPVRFIDSNGKDGWDIVVGYGIGFVTNVIPGTGFLRDTYTPTDASDYNNALRGMDNASMVVGAAMFVDGGNKTATGSGVVTTGLVVSAVSGGTATVVGGPVAAGGAIVIGAGTIEMGAGSLLMSNAETNKNAGYDRGKKSNVSSGNKNSQHANQKAKSSAEQKYQEAKKKFDELDKKPNKSPEDKKETDYWRKQVNHWKMKQDFSGENHSRNAKGIR